MNEAQEKTLINLIHEVARGVKLANSGGYSMTQELREVRVLRQHMMAVTGKNVKIRDAKELYDRVW